MKHATNCKVCAKPIVVTIDDAYAALGNDPMKLLPLATCNRCADLRVKRNTIETAIKRVCEDLVQGVVSKEQKPVIAKQLKTLTQKYALLVADWHNMSGMIWEEAFVQMLMENPKQYYTILANYWKTFRQTQRPAQQEVQPA